MAEKKVSEEHSELYHYTTAIGLEGIVRSQRLWATHIGYLNDAEEHTGFFVRRLPQLLAQPSREAVEELLETEEGQAAIATVGGPDRAVTDFQRDLSESAQRITLQMNEPYVVSFCSGNAHLMPHDGLLSQWRGYGADGGYAIVFDAARLETMLIEKEGRAFDYQFANFSDVDYDFPESVGRPAHPERLAWERDVQNAFKRFILTLDQKCLDSLHIPMAGLSSRYKHYGFSEEAEVRIVAMPVSDAVYEMEVRLATAKDKLHELRARKPINFRERRGQLIPYIKLFGPGRNGPDDKLPIRRILVGPHPDRMKRATAVRALLRELGLDIAVEVSGIPYLGL
jgi:hypothetical protein